MLTAVDSVKAVVSGRFIFVRWFAVFAGILALGLLAYFRNFPPQNILPVAGPLIAVFFLVAIINVFFLLLFNSASRRQSYSLFLFLDIIQVGLDLILAFIVIAIIPDVTGLLPLVLFLPIIEALFLFTSATALLVSIVAGGGLLALSFVPPLDLSLVSGLVSVEIFQTGTNLNKFEPGIFAGVYILFVVLLSYLMDIVTERGLRSRNGMTKSRSDVTRENGRREVEQAEWLRHYSAKMEENGRLLQAKEIELSLAKEQLETLENAKSEFISVTTHQLRTPLSAIKWTFNMMISEQLGPVNPEQKEFLDKGYQSALRMISIVNNLVHIDHATTKPEDYNFAPTDLAALIANVMFEFTNQAASKKITLGFDRPVNPLPAAEIDEGKIRMMLENLIDNAIKYTPKEGKITISLSDRRLNTAQPAVEIKVADTGVGIPPEEQKKIFHKFFRASNARRAEPDGSGLGLYIAHDIVERHQGVMHFESEEGKGTVFHVALPLRQASQLVV